MKQDDTKLRNRYRKCLKAAKRVLDSEMEAYSPDSLISVANLLFHESYGHKGDTRYKDE